MVLVTTALPALVVSEPVALGGAETEVASAVVAAALVSLPPGTSRTR